MRGAAGNAKADTAMRGRKGGSIRTAPYCYKLVKLVMDQHLEPLIVFAFSKKDCEFYALQLAKIDFNEGEFVSTLLTKYLFPFLPTSQLPIHKS